MGFLDHIGSAKQSPSMSRSVMDEDLVSMPAVVAVMSSTSVSKTSLSAKKTKEKNYNELQTRTVSPLSDQIQLGDFIH